MSKHTPGPWNLELHPTSIGSMYRIQQPRACIYIDGMRAPNVKDAAWEEDHANARLIASAPIMLEALEKLARLGNGDRYGNSIGNEIAIDAIAKAKGGTP